MCESTESSFPKFIFFPAHESFKDLASLFIHVSADNRMLMQIEKRKQNGWVLLQSRGGEAVSVCNILHVRFHLFAFALQYVSQNTCCWCVVEVVSGSFVCLYPKENARFSLVSFPFDHMW